MHKPMYTLLIITNIMHQKSKNGSQLTILVRINPKSEVFFP